jgi:hypothetical protein
MPELPSGLQLAISRDALFDHGGNWFTCPDGHFWFWVPAPEMGPPPFDLDAEIMQQAQHAPIPSSREEAKQYLRVLEMRPDGKYSWRGEWLSLFPRYTDLDDRDLAAWNEWINRPQTEQFLDATIEECRRLAEVSKNAKGYAVIQEDRPPGQEKSAGGWVKGSLRIPTKQN